MVAPVVIARSFDNTRGFGDSGSTPARFTGGSIRERLLMGSERSELEPARGPRPVRDVGPASNRCRLKLRNWWREARVAVAKLAVHQIDRWCTRESVGSGHPARYVWNRH